MAAVATLDPAWVLRDRRIRELALAPWTDFALRYFDIRAATGVEDACWQPYQITTLNEQAMFASFNKSRQIGMSFTLAGRSEFKGLLQPRTTYIFVSFNLMEAQEKILYAKQWWESRNPEPWTVPLAEEFTSDGTWLGPSPHRIREWPELVKDTTLELQWSNGLRLISHPCRPPRGKRASVILDELAHYQNSRVIYTAAVPMITRGYGELELWVCSTPLGAGDLFHELHTDTHAHPDYVRHDFMWWEIDVLCQRRKEAAAAYAEGMGVEEMIDRFGTRQLHMLFRNISLDDFLQEYHGQFHDSAHAFLPWDLIKACYPSWWNPKSVESDDEGEWEQQLEDEYRDAYFCRRAEGVEDALQAIAELALAVRRGQVGRDLVLTYDVGRTRDASELCVGELHAGRIYQRLLVTLRTTPFDKQKLVMAAAYQYLPVIEGWIDATGMGMDIAEWANQRYGERARGVTFDNNKKDSWAKTLKLVMEQYRLTLIPDREQEAQLHSVKRRAAGKIFLYEIEDNEISVGTMTGKKVKHHADKFWVVAMMAALGTKLLGGDEAVAVTTDEERQVPEAQHQLSRKGFSQGKSRARDAGRLVSDKMASRLG